MSLSKRRIRGTVRARIESLERRRLFNGGGFPINAFASTGSLTSTFPGGGDDFGSSVAVQSDGKVVVGGQAHNDFALERFNTNGTLDMTFGVGGQVTTDFYGGLDAINTVEILTNGKILAAGHAEVYDGYQGGGHSDYAVARYNANGTLDTTFGAGKGWITYSYDGNALNDQALNAIGVQSSGQIICAGQFFLPGGAGGHMIAQVFRLNADGSVDSTFTHAGSYYSIYEVPFPVSAGVLGMVIQPNNEIVLSAGSGSEYSATGVYLARLNANGSPDQSFGTSGIVAAGSYYTSIGIALTSAGQIVVATPGLGVMGVQRYNTDGSIDTNFGTAGYASVSFPGFTDTANTNCTDTQVLVQRNGNIIAAGYALAGNRPDIDPYYFAAAKFLSSGTVDGSFGQSGTFLASVSNNRSVGAAAGLASNGDFFLVGTLDKTTPDGTLSIGLIDVDGGMKVNVTGPNTADTIVLRSLPANAADYQILVNNVSVNSGPWIDATEFHLYGGKLDDQVSIQRIVDGDAVYFTDSGGTSTVTLGTNGNLRTLAGPIFLSNLAGLTTLNLNAASTTVSTVITLTATSITGLTPFPINFADQNLGALNLTTGSGKHTIVVDSTDLGPQFAKHFGITPAVIHTIIPGTTTLTVGGQDTIYIGGNSSSASMQSIFSPIAIAGVGAGTAAVFLNDSTDQTPSAVVVTQSAVTGLSPAAISFVGKFVSALTITTGRASSTVNVQSTYLGYIVPALPPKINYPKSPTTLISGGGVDAVTLGVSGSTQQVDSPVVISGSVAAFNVTADDSADPAMRTVTVTDHSVTGISPGTLTYTGAALQSLSVITGLAGDAVAVQSTGLGAYTVYRPPLHFSVVGMTTISSAGGNDSVTIGNANTLAGIKTPLTIQNIAGATTVRFSDALDKTLCAVSDVLYLTNLMQINGLAPAVIDYSTLRVKLAGFSVTGKVYDSSSTGSGQTFPGATVYFDANDNGVYDPSIDIGVSTDAAGNYALIGLTAGTYKLRATTPPGWSVASPSGGSQTIVGVDPSFDTGKNFGLTPTAYATTVQSIGGLVAYFPFDSGADSAVNGITGSYQGNATVGTAGSGAPISGEAAGSSLSLDGNNSYVTTSLTTQDAFNLSATIVCWFKLSSLPSVSGHVYTIVAKSQFADDFDLQIETDNALHFYTDQGSNTSYKPSSWGTGWHMVVAEFSSTLHTRTLYLDGKQVALTTGFTAPHSASANPLTIGASYLWPGRYFAGSIDDVAVYDTDLTSQQVAALYHYVT